MLQKPEIHVSTGLMGHLACLHAAFPFWVCFGSESGNFGLAMVRILARYGRGKIPTATVSKDCITVLHYVQLSPPYSCHFSFAQVGICTVV